MPTGMGSRRVKRTGSCGNLSSLGKNGFGGSGVSVAEAAAMAVAVVVAMAAAAVAAVSSGRFRLCYGSPGAGWAVLMRGGGRAAWVIRGRLGDSTGSGVAGGGVVAARLQLNCCTEHWLDQRPVGERTTLKRLPHDTTIQPAFVTHVAGAALDWIANRKPRRTAAPASIRCEVSSRSRRPMLPSPLPRTRVRALVPAVALVVPLEKPKRSEHAAITSLPPARGHRTTCADPAAKSGHQPGAGARWTRAGSDG
jgi:hypothetical protein